MKKTAWMLRSQLETQTADTPVGLKQPYPKKRLFYAT